MWATVDKQTQQVVGMVQPTATQEEINEAYKLFDLIEMTVDNSPAYLNGYYINGRFTKPTKGV